MSLRARLDALEARAAAARPAPAAEALRNGLADLVRGRPIRIPDSLGEEASMVETLLDAYDALPALLRAQMARQLGVEVEADLPESDPEA